MPKRRLDITGFQGTSLPSVDPLDLPPEIAAYTENVDATSRPGILQGLYQTINRADNSTAGNNVDANWICPVVLDGTVYVYDNAGGVWHTIDLDTYADSSFSSTSPGGTLVQGAQTSMGEAARFAVRNGNALWVGPIRKNTVFDGSRTAAAKVVDASLAPPEHLDVRAVAFDGDDGSLRKGTHYHFFAAWLYDGYQEGPLYEVGSFVRGGGQSEATLEVIWQEPSTGATPDRAEALLLYAVDDRNGQTSAPEDLPRRFVERLPLDDSSLWSSPSSATIGHDLTEDTNWSPGPPLYAFRSKVDEDGYTFSDGVTSKQFTIDASQITGSTITEIVFSGAIEIEVHGDASARGKINVQTPDGNTSITDKSTSEAVSETLTGLTLSGTDTITVDIQLSASATDGHATAAAAVESLIVKTSGGSGQEVTAEITFQGDGGQTYERRTGVTRPAAQDQIKEYEHAVTSGPYHVVGGPTVDEQLGGSHNKGSYVLRSKAYRPDMHDWVSDFVQVGGKIQGLASHNGFVLCFTEEDTYIIDEAQWAIVERLTNVTAFDDRAWTSTPFGLVFCDSNGVYLWEQGDHYRVLSDAIEVTESGIPQYRQEVTANTFKHLTYDPSTRMVCVLYNGSSTGSSIEGWAYVMPLPSDRQKRPQPYWTHLSNAAFLLQSNVGGLIEADGAVFGCATDGLVELFGDSARSSWTWRSKALAPEGATRKWTAYLLSLVPGSYGGTVTYREDGGSWLTASTDPNQTGVYVVNSEDPKNGGSAPWAKVKRLDVELQGTSSDQVKALGLTYRGLPALSDDN